ncbi:MAG TPA: tRNA (adenosine(37)-N6)-dimethylallyltransferase MiaA [Candidatus Binatia bacterium]|jgi:tRNA dimethylallyltransferase
MTRRVLALVGPTASGKTEVALALAERLGAEIVGADSRQVYRYLDIGTAKPSAAERARVGHHMVDVAEPDEIFDAARFRRAALAAIDDIASRGRPVIVCGGTGLYLRALLRGLFPAPPRAPELRARLHALEEREPGALHRRLARVDPDAAARLHPNDLLRVVRALEVEALTGRPISAWQGEHRFPGGELDALVLGCHRPADELAARIEARCDAMLAAGLLDEIAALWARGFGAELPSMQSVGYREMGAHLSAQRAAGAADLAAARGAFVRATRRLAKRQRTWFGAERAIEWFHPEQERDALVARAEGWLERPWPSPISISSYPSPR